ncbi:MAG: radical SAM protein [Candidatus Heimdallarchaeota archaeon]|nr:radical SAM protein [Candidatus Heimdallarchaeota archaeon]
MNIEERKNQGADIESFDNVTLTNKTITQICKDDLTNEPLRKYYRFRYSKQFYGGIVTGDIVGCNLRCAYCWSQKTAWYPQKGSWQSVDQVVKILLNLANNNHCEKIRLSGGEPTLCRKHLITIIQQLPDHFSFILETNGILLTNKEYIQELETLTNPPYVRISLKAGQTLYSRITGASLEAYRAQLQTIKILKHSSLQFNVAIIAEFFTSEEIRKIERLIAPKRLEREQLIVYPFVRETLRKRGLESLGI